MGGRLKLRNVYYDTVGSVYGLGGYNLNHNKTAGYSYAWSEEKGISSGYTPVREFVEKNFK